MDKLYHESILLLNSEKKTFLNRNYYGARDVFFDCLGVSKGQGYMNNIYLERCADVITSLILKYGPALKRKWNLNEWISNIQAESLRKDIACKRYQRYFTCMMNMKSLPV